MFSAGYGHDAMGSTLRLVCDGKVDDGVNEKVIALWHLPRFTEVSGRSMLEASGKS